MTILDDAVANLVTVEGTPDDARLRAMTIAAETNREHTPVRVFQQGNRTMLSAVLPVRVLKRILDHNHAQRGIAANKALTAGNRPLDNAHVNTIAAYLRRAVEKGEDYIIPSLTVNSTSSVQVIVPAGGYTPTTGYAVFPDDTAVYITDGQHRYRAICKVADELRGTPAGDEFMNVGVPLMMTIENDLLQVHQDFADAGKTKPLPSSLVAVFDTRQPANRAVMEICERARLLKGRTDATSKTLSTSSPFVFLVNQIRQFVKSSLTGSPAVSEASFAKQSEDVMSNPEARERWIRSRVAFLNILTEIIPDWTELAQLSPPGDPDGAEVLSRTKAIREHKRVPMSAAFLNAIGVVSHDVLKNVTSTEVDETHLENELRIKLEPLRNVDWERSGEIWQGNLVVDGTIKTQTTPVRSAAGKLNELLGIA